MARTRIALTIDESVLRAVSARAARLGKDHDEVIGDALRRDLGFDLFDRLWSRNDLDEAAAVELGLDAQRAARRQDRNRVTAEAIVRQIRADQSDSGTG